MVAEGGGDAGVACQPQDGDGEVAQAGHDTRGAGGADLGSVFAEVQVADPVQAVLDRPVTADDGREFGRAGLGSGQRRDRVDGLTGPFLLPCQLAAAGDLDGLGGVRERQPGGHGGDFEGSAPGPARPGPAARAGMRAGRTGRPGCA